MVTLGAKGKTALDVPVACSLEPAAVPQRLDDWAGVLTAVTRRTQIDGGLRIDLGSDVDLGMLGRLIGAEQRCCAFFRFTLDVDVDGTTLEVRAPERAADMLIELFGAPT